MRYFYIILYSPIYYPCAHLHYLHTKTCICLLGVYLIHSSYSRLGLCTYILSITICTYIYIYMYVCMYIYIYIHTCIHTFTCKAAETIGSKNFSFLFEELQQVWIVFLDMASFAYGSAGIDTRIFSRWWPCLGMCHRRRTLFAACRGEHPQDGCGQPRKYFFVKSLPHFIWKGFSYYCSGNSCFYLFSGGNI